MFVPVNIGRDGKQGRPPRKRPPRKKQTAKDGVHSGVTHFCARCGNQAELIWVSRKGKVRKIRSSRSSALRCNPHPCRVWESGWTDLGQQKGEGKEDPELQIRRGKNIRYSRNSETGLQCRGQRHESDKPILISGG